MRDGDFFHGFFVGLYTPTLLQIRLAARPPTNIKMRLYAEPPAFPTCPLDIVLHGFFRRQILIHKVISHYELVRCIKVGEAKDNDERRFNGCK